MMALRLPILVLTLLCAGCALPPPRALAADEGWYCEPCSRIPKRVALTPETELLGAARERRVACRDRR